MFTSQYNCIYRCVVNLQAAAEKRVQLVPPVSWLPVPSASGGGLTVSTAAPVDGC